MQCKVSVRIHAPFSKYSLQSCTKVWQRWLNMHTFFKLANAAPLMCSLNSSRLLTIYRWNGTTKWDFDFSSSSCHMASHKAATKTGLECRYTLTTLNFQCAVETYSHMQCTCGVGCYQQVHTWRTIHMAPNGSQINASIMANVRFYELHKD